MHIDRHIQTHRDTDTLAHILRDRHNDTQTTRRQVHIQSDIEIDIPCIEEIATLSENPSPCHLLQKQFVKLFIFRQICFADFAYSHHSCLQLFVIFFAQIYVAEKLKFSKIHLCGFTHFQVESCKFRYSTS